MAYKNLLSRVVWLVLLVFTVMAGRLVAADRPTSILVLLADDVGWKDFGCYGNGAIHTPNIDSLARQGLLFSHAFLTTSSCSPTRISILTGKYPHATGAEDLHMPLPADQLIVPSYLQEKGYFTGHMAKTHYGPNGMKQFQWYSPKLAFDKFMDACGEQPFFMWVGFHDAHRSYKPGAFDPPHEGAKVEVPPYLADTPETRDDLALYYDEVARMDKNIGSMMDELKRRGRLDDTLVVFLSDNGMPFPRAKGTAYDSGIGTPLIMVWQGQIIAGSQHNDLASVIDLAPTFLAVAGVDKPADMQGKSMLSVMRDPTLAGDKMVFAERNWHNCDEHMRAVRTDRYKLIRNAYLDQPHGTPADCSKSPSWVALASLRDTDSLTPEQALLFAAPRPRLELFDLEVDPWEFNNLADDPKHAAIVARLEAAIDKWGRDTGDFPSTARRRADNTNRQTGQKFTRKIAPQREL